MPKLSLEAIQIIDAIERYGGFSAAAEQLHKVPSTISYTVAKLEEQLGFVLFERNGPRVSLSPVGRELLKEGRWLLAAAADLECRLQRVATGYEAELRIVHDSLLPTASLIEDFRAFEALHCGTRLRIATEVMTGTWEALKEGRADLIIACGEGPAGGGYKSTEVGVLEFAFCVARDHPLTRLPQPLRREDLVPYTAIVVSDTARVLPERTVGLISAQNRITVPDMAAKIALQVAGLGYGFLPRVCVAAALSRGDLRELAVTEPRPDETFRLAWRPDASGDALKWWRQRLQRRLIPDLLLPKPNSPTDQP